VADSDKQGPYFKSNTLGLTETITGIYIDTRAAGGTGATVLIEMSSNNSSDAADGTTWATTQSNAVGANDEHYEKEASFTVGTVTADRYLRCSLTAVGTSWVDMTVQMDVTMGIVLT
jgi:hypothetical protein